MIRINLLPYRDQKRQQQIVAHIAAMFAVVLLATIIVVGLDFWKSSELDALRGEFSQLQAKNAELKKKIGKIKDIDSLRSDVQAKLGIVDELQLGRFRSLHTLKVLAEVIPDDVWLISVVDSGNKINLSGVGKSNNSIANFMRSLEDAEIFSNVDLGLIQRSQQGNIPLRSFNLSMTRLDDHPYDAGKTASGGAGR